MTTATQDTLTAGIVKWFNGERGFITTDDYRDVFCHASQLIVQDHELSKGERVTFLEDVGRDGRSYARRIVVVNPVAFG
jgi:cold shock CspA family protein